MTVHPRRLDFASLLLLLSGVGSGLLAYWLIVDRGASPLYLIPAVVAATVGAEHLTKRQVPRS